MSFSQRQQHCLEAMGIVPWVAKTESPSLAPAVITASTELSADQRGDHSAECSTTVASMLTGADSKFCESEIELSPSSVEELKVWLPSQVVGLLSVRSQHQAFVGQAEAPLLVVVESAKHNDQIQSLPASPFTTEAAQLFDLMMRAIQVTMGQRKLCHLSRSTATSSAAESVCVAQLCVPQTKAILLLVQDWERLAEPVSDHFRLDQPALPVWRIPHPDLLLEFNQLKRQAWRSLQALQCALS